MELLDIVDENNNLTDRVEDKDIVHEQGLWHREVSIWVMNEKGEVLLQKRAATKRLRPNKWAMCGGHVGTGENEEVAAKRELFEEMGLKASSLELLFIDKTDISDNRRFSYMYFWKTNAKIEDCTIQYDELSEIKYITIAELERIVKDEDEDYVFPRRNYMPRIIEELKKRAN